MERLHILVRFQLTIISSIFIYLDENILQKRPDRTDIAVIMYTSGSTGTPKGYFSFKDQFIDLNRDESLRTIFNRPPWHIKVHTYFFLRSVR